MRAHTSISLHVSLIEVSKKLGINRSRAAEDGLIDLLEREHPKNKEVAKAVKAARESRNTSHQ